jgi:undecaprenyl phosphate-alpha-L-ara4FN deformylase
VIEAGLRIDVDTFAGTRDGVPRLLDTLEKHGVRASFFFSVGPDNMGRHLWRLFRPAFARKMLRSKAASLYGWQIVFAGTAWPGRSIGRHLGQVIREADSGPHEVGLHAWDHQGWQARVGRWGDDEIERQIRQGTDRLGDILGRAVDCSATPGWRTNQRVVDVKQRLGLRYNSDCRGSAMFRPQLGDGGLGTPQIPVDLPTYDEVVGADVRPEDFNDFILARFKPGRLNVYTVHAEVEGGIMANNFDDLLARAADQGIHFRPLGEMLPDDVRTLPAGRIEAGTVDGREGWLGTQVSA